jgi:hypothetical protein
VSRAAPTLGKCRACGEEAVLPAWTAGRCFLCACEGRAELDRSELCVRPRDVDEEDPTRLEILGLFEEAQGYGHGSRWVPSVHGGDGGPRDFGIRVPAPSRVKGRCPRCDAPSGDRYLCIACQGWQMRLYVRPEYERRKALGLCVLCAREPARPGMVTCGQHKTDLKAAREAYARKKAAAECARCRRATCAPGQSRCPACATLRCGEQRALVERRIALGMCRSCGRRTAVGGTSRCQPCKDKRKDAAAARQVLGAPS